jgi:hypothetical protein
MFTDIGASGILQQHDFMVTCSSDGFMRIDDLLCTENYTMICQCVVDDNAACPNLRLLRYLCACHEWVIWYSSYFVVKDLTLLKSYFFG